MTALAGLGIGSGCVRKQFFQPDARPDAVLTQPLPAAADSVRGVTAGRHYARHGRLYQALVGRHYRSSWAVPITVPVLRLPSVRPGGLTPGKVGGGFNSTSLSLSTPNGSAYMLRTVDKDPIRATPKLLRGTFLVNALRDNISATQPYGPLVVQPLAQAVGVPRAAPRLFYVRPDDPNFQSDSLRLFRGQLAYLEERYAVAPAASGAAGKVVGSKPAFAAVVATPDQQFDQRALLRARLLDAWLGDWDRHPGQWNWNVRPQPESGASISPLPKDRDMVFYRLDDGVLGWLVGHLAIPHWTTFRARYPKLAHLMSNGHYLDTRGLNQLSRAEYKAEALAMQQLLPDAVISTAVHRIPSAAFALEGPGIIAALQARRDNLPAFADGFYQHLARRPMVAGTALPERFVVHRYSDSTVVAVYPAQAAISQQNAFFHRTFFPAETKEIQLEGLGGDDVFTIEQHGQKTVSRPVLRIYGGPDADELQGSKYGRGVHFSQGSARAKDAFDKSPKE
ncbi:hypothetical protein [Hymenobacter arizonensis]|uniref:hypothetical protein n=1 Tax=Hymenobacter arizonensis TaxID=1227077 RepID=UPI000B8377B3|nr:hypothetical protein [Hymenobacter arizonensis]